MQPGDEELMQKVKNGDMDAFDILVRRWEHRLFNVIYKITGDFEASRDIRQEVLLRVYQSAWRYRPHGQFKTWLYRIAVNCSINELRRRQRRRMLPLTTYHRSEDGEEQMLQNMLPDSNPGPEEIMEQREMNEQIHRALDRLPAEQRAVIVLKHYEGLKFRQIASILNCPPGTVKSRMRRGLEQLRMMLKHICWEGEANHEL